MSLISFHRLLIAIAIVFCGGYSIWEAARFLSGGSISSVLLAIGFGAAALGLGYYLRHLGRILRLGDEGAPGADPRR